MDYFSFKKFMTLEATKPSKKVKPSKTGNSPESALPADLATASTTPGTSTSTGGATATRNTGAATGGAVTITISGSSSTDTATTTGAGAGKGGKSSGKDTDKGRANVYNVTVNSTGRSGDAQDDRKFESFNSWMMRLRQAAIHD